MNPFEAMAYNRGVEAVRSFAREAAEAILQRPEPSAEARSSGDMLRKFADNTAFLRVDIEASLATYGLKFTEVPAEDETPCP